MYKVASRRYVNSKYPRKFLKELHGEFEYKVGKDVSQLILDTYWMIFKLV